MILHNWLEQLCLMIPNVQAAILVDSLEVSSTDFALASWPSDTVNCSRFSASLALLKAQLSPVVTFGKSSSQDSTTFASTSASKQDSSEKSTTTLMIAYPLDLGADFSGAVVLEIAAKPTQQAVLLQMLNWGQSWLKLLLDNAQSTESKSAAPILPTEQYDSAQHAQTQNGHIQNVHIPNENTKYVHLFKMMFSCHRYQEALMTMVTEIARCWHFDHVSVGTINGDSIDVKAISHCANFDPRSNRVRAIQQVMQEMKEGLAIADTSLFPSAETLGIRDKFGYSQNKVLSVPLWDKDQIIAILVCERKDKITHAETASQRLETLKTLAEMLGPLMLLHQNSSRTITEHIVQRAQDGLNRVTQGRLGKYPIIISFALMLVLTGFMQNNFRVAAEATLEGRIQRAVVAPFDAYIENAFARAGEHVQKGDVIAQLDDQSLILEKQGWLSQREEYKKQYRNELATMNHAKARIVKAQIAQSEAQIAIAEGRLQKAKLVSPLSGIIIEGDLSRSLGAPVKQGQVLFEVAPLNEYRVLLKIHERDIAYLKKGQQGTLLLTAYPNEVIPLMIENVAVVYEQEGDYTWYRTEASIASEHMSKTILLRPGMEGLGKIAVGQKSYAWIWFHSLTDWLRLWVWSWMP
ncbi:MAG: multidrug resistance efflux pump [Oleiphilaceae bacterium]